MSLYERLKTKLSAPIALLMSVLGGTIVLTLVFWLLLSLAYIVPQNWMKSNLLDSYDALAAEGHYPVSYLNEKPFDNYTVAVMLNEAASGDGSPLVDSLLAKRFAPTDEGQIEALRKSIDGEVNDTYARYWHGYLVYLKPLLIFFDVTQIRMMMLAVFVLLLFFAAYTLCRQLGVAGMIAACFLILAETLFGGFDAAVTLPMFPSFALSMIGIVWVLKIECRNDKGIRTGFFLIGACTVFLDFLDNPILTLGLPLTAYILKMYLKGGSVKKCVVAFVSSCAMWLLGYGLLWVSKWALAALVTGVDVIGEGLASVSFRLGMDGVPEESGFVPFASIAANITALGWLRHVLLLAAVLAIVTVVFGVGTSSSANRSRLIGYVVILVVIALIPYCWYLILSNHSIIHVDIIAYRNQLLTLFALGGVIATCCGGEVCFRKRKDATTLLS